jgi:hypothetical protein
MVVFFPGDRLRGFGSGPKGGFLSLLPVDRDDDGYINQLGE